MGEREGVGGRLLAELSGVVSRLVWPSRMLCWCRKKDVTLTQFLMWLKLAGACWIPILLGQRLRLFWYGFVPCCKPHLFQEDGIFVEGS